MRLEPAAGSVFFVRFKRQFASCERPLRTLPWSPDSIELQGAHIEDDLLTAFTELPTSPAVPNGVAAQGGALLYRYFG
jgi:hypothetical protein